MQIVFILVSFLFTNPLAVMNVSRKLQEITFREIFAFERKACNYQFKRLENKQLCKCFQKTELKLDKCKMKL